MSDAKILIVEDEGIEALDIQRRLIGLGYPAPEFVFSGEEAVKKAEESCPDLVLMDIMLGGEIDGVAAAEQIRARFDVPVIYLTAYADEDTLRRAKITEPYGYIVKPFKDREMHITIDIALYRHQMQRRIRESEKWLSTTLRSIGDAVVATDEKGVITFMNAVGENLTGWKLEDVLNRKLAEVFYMISKQTGRPVRDPVARVILEAPAVALPSHTVLAARDGRQIPIEGSASPIKDDKGNTIGVILVCRDITEREKAEEELRRAYAELEERVAVRTADLALTNKHLKQEIEQRKRAEKWLEQKIVEVERAERRARFLASELETVLNTMNEAVFVVDTNQNLVRINRSYAQLVGLQGEEDAHLSLGQHIERLRPRNERGEALSLEQLPVGRALQGQSFTNQILLITLPDGNGERFLGLSGAPLRDVLGAVVGAVIVARDVTEAKELDQLKDEFISVASHELRAPLTAVKGYAQLLARQLEAAREKTGEVGMARRILHQANRMNELTERLLDVSRIQFGRLTLQKQTVDLAELVANVSEQMKVTDLRHPLRVSSPRPVHVSVDPGRIEQVLVNLISNAAKYSPEGREVEVRLEQWGGNALISVMDHGYGIPTDQQPFVFQRFYRARTGEDKIGLGLGLYVSKGIVEAHGGKIWFDSTEGEGTTFHVQLPAAQSVRVQPES